MENNLEELKKEFIEKFCFSGTLAGITNTNKADVFWQWFSSKIEPLQQALSKLQSQYLELEAENEKLREVVSQTANLLTNSILDSENLVAEARKEERAMIEQYISCNIFYTLGLYDIWNMLDGQQKETLTEAINIGISQAITADQQGDKI